MHNVVTHLSPCVLDHHFRRFRLHFVVVCTARRQIVPSQCAPFLSSLLVGVDVLRAVVSLSEGLSYVIVVKREHVPVPLRIAALTRHSLACALLRLATAAARDPTLQARSLAPAALLLQLVRLRCASLFPSLVL